MRMDFSSTRIRNIPASQLCGHFSPGQDAGRFVTLHLTTAELLHCWCDHALWFDAALLLAHALHKRPAIWWAYLVCADRYESASEPQDAVLCAVEGWLRDPNESTRADVRHAARVCEKRDPRYWLAMAVHWCSDAVAIASGVAESAAPFLYARAVAATIDIAAAQPDQAPMRTVFYQATLCRGVAIANGENGRFISQSLG